MRLGSALLCLIFLLPGCGKPASVPADVRVLKEGVFTITPDQPFAVGEIIPKGEGQYDVVIDVKVKSGDAIQVEAWQGFSEGKNENALSRLSTTSPVKEIRLTDKVRESGSQSSNLRIVIKTTGKASDVALKITKQFELGK